MHTMIVNKLYHKMKKQNKTGFLTFLLLLFEHYHPWHWQGLELQNKNGLRWTFWDDSYCKSCYKKADDSAKGTTGTGVYFLYIFLSFKNQNSQVYCTLTCQITEFTLKNHFRQKGNLYVTAEKDFLDSISLRC